MRGYVNNYSRFFKEVTDFSPYPFQKKIFKEFWIGNNILLKAPTGAGKTWASIAPFVFCWKEWKEGKQESVDYPRKLIYSLPLRTLANSLYKEVSTRINNEFPELKISVKLQTGEFPDDIFFEGDIIFTTIDQTLSNILGIPLSLPRKLANINAGAVLSSYLVFDEFHLLDPKRSLDTVISLLKVMKSVTPFCLMTATLSENFLTKTVNYLDAEIINVKKEDYNKFDFVKNKAEKFITVSEKCLDIKTIIENHNKQSIVICNTVERCKQIFLNLLEEKNKGRIHSELICIHSQFFQSDRKIKEKQILEYFGKGSEKNAILVSTQVIEVGLDISCDVMHTEISPINSLLQRMGRCARWRGQGKIFVYDTPKRNYRPYSKELCETTLVALKDYQNIKLDYFISQELIQKVLNEYEKTIFDNIKYNNMNKWEMIRDCWIEGGKDKARQLIRDIRSINVVLLSEDTRTDSLYKYESISINPYSLKTKLQEILDKEEGELPNLVFTIEQENFLFDEDWEYESKKKLENILIDRILYENIVALNSKYIGYSHEFGLDFEENAGRDSNEIQKKDKFQYTLKMDTYEQHINWMLEIFENRYKDSIRFPLQKITKFRYKFFNFDDIIKYIIVMHDYGKLNQTWQNIVNDYQSKKMKLMNKNWESTLLAHTDFDPNNEEDKKLETESCRKFKVKRKPPHSGIGAFVSYRILPQIFNLERTPKNNSFLKIILTTIIRHHSAYTNNVPKYEINKEIIKFMNEKMIKNLLPEFYINNISKYGFFNKSNKIDLKPATIKFDDNFESYLYFILVRVLRLCDQHSFDLNKKNIKEDIDE